ncbi:hypothetical protein JCM11251_004430 [Rhodosporidiobolus azoricus]
MFGEDPSESPRHPSPWLSRSSGSTPSPLSLPTPDSIPSTPTDALDVGRARRRSSLEDLELLEGLGEDFDSLSVSKGRLRSTPSPPWTEEITLADGMSKLEELAPEVDHEGHIEYKFKLATPTSLHRLEKLRTQLAWRLREGGGTAVYELGLLDDGKIVGLPQADMEESLHTLGRMLGGIGGGRVEIARVVRIGGSAEGSPPPSSPSRSVFPSFDVSASTADLDYSGNSLISNPPHSAPNVPPLPEVIQPVSFFPPDKKNRGPTPYPAGRTQEEQAIFRRDKRDQRRLRRVQATAAVGEGRSLSPAFSPVLYTSSSSTSSSTVSYTSSLTVSPASSACPTPPISIPPIRPTRTGSSTRNRGGVSNAPKPPRPPRPPRRTTTKQQRQAAAAAKRAACGIPSPQVVEQVKHGGVRWVVEAVVHKASSAVVEEGKKRRKSSAAGRSGSLAAVSGMLAGSHASSPEDALTSATEAEDNEAEDGEEDDSCADEDDPAEEGWDYLDFDLASLSSSVKSAAAAARSASGGVARAATAAVGA